MRFQQRIELAFRLEQARRSAEGAPKLTKTDLWKAANLSSGAVSHWFSGDNSADLPACLAVADVLNCDGFWLFDETGPSPEELKSKPMGTLLKLKKHEHPEIVETVRIMRLMPPRMRAHALQTVALIASGYEEPQKGKRCPVIDMQEARRLRMR